MRNMAAANTAPFGDASRRAPDPRQPRHRATGAGNVGAAPALPLRFTSGTSVHQIQWEASMVVGRFAVRVFKHFAWLEVVSDKMALSRPGRTPGWYPIPPTSK